MVNLQQRTAALASLALHTIVVTTIVMLAPRAAVVQPRYRVTTITFAPAKGPRIQRVQPVRPNVTPEPTTVSEQSAPAVHRAGFDQNRTAPSAFAAGEIIAGRLDQARAGPRASAAGEVIAGKWDVMHAGSAPTFYPGTPGPAGLYAPRPAQLSGLIAAEAADVPALLLATPTPTYTEEARQLHVTGEVVLEVLLGATGKVQVLRVLSGLGHGLDEAAITAVNHTRCRPALRAGQPVGITATVRVIFQLT